MPSNDEVVWGLPQLQFPTCENHLHMNQKISKLSKQQRREKYGDGESTMKFSPRDYPTPHVEDCPSNHPEATFLVVSCDNERCPQYNKIKVVRIPRLSAPSVKLDL